MELSDYYIHRVITSWLQLGAVLVAAVALIISIIKSRIDRKVAIYEAAHEGLVKFLELSIAHPDLYLLEPENRHGIELTETQREQERSAYMLFLVSYERMYRSARATGQLEQLAKYDDLVRAYAAIPEFRAMCEIYNDYSGTKFTGYLGSVLERRREKS